MGKDFYGVLDIAPETEKEEIRKAYLQLARQYHPDLNKNPDARERFEEINQAYTILSDDESRFIYNLYYKGAQDFSTYQELTPWWKRYELALSLSILALGTFIWIGLLLWLLAWF
jgi:DnaJ-class molecular chaperone